LHDDGLNLAQRRQALVLMKNSSSAPFPPASSNKTVFLLKPSFSSSRKDRQTPPASSVPFKSLVHLASWYYVRGIIAEGFANNPPPMHLQALQGQRRI
jgi:hypothetical protein